MAFPRSPKPILKIVYYLGFIPLLSLITYKKWEAWF
jgi:hypothetical protein